MHAFHRPRTLPPRRCLLRELLDLCLPLAADLDAFCSDHLPLTYRRFSCGLDRVQKITLMLEHAGSEAVEAALWAAFPRECAARSAEWRHAESGVAAQSGLTPTDSAPPAAELHPHETSPTRTRRAWLLRFVALCLGGALIAGLLAWRYRAQAATVSALPQSAPTSIEAPADMHCFAGGTIRQQTESGEISVHVLPFCLDRYLVTARQYHDCHASGACQFAQTTNYHKRADKAAQGVLDEFCTAQLAQPGKLPMNCVSWHEARSYCEAQGKRLPSSAEWELAAGALENQLYPWGSGPPTEALVNGCDARCVKWAADRKKIWKREQGTRVLLEPADGSRSDRLFDADDGFAATSPIDAKPPSIPYGLYDLSGNLRQWTRDVPTDCSGPSCRELYILKGGSWGDVWPDVFNRKMRTKAHPALRSEMHGFRCAKTLKPEIDNRATSTRAQYGN